MEEYSFGNGTLRVKADHEISFPIGAQSLVETFEDCRIIHRFTITSLISHKVEHELYYNWYQICDYSREIDRVSMIAEQTKVNTGNIANCEEAILELSEIVGGESV